MNKFLVFDILVILNYLKKCYLDCFYYFKNIFKIFIKKYMLELMMNFKSFDIIICMLLLCS